MVEKLRYEAIDELCDYRAQSCTDLAELFRFGFVGYDNLPNEAIQEEYNSVFDTHLVIVEKKVD